MERQGDEIHITTDEVRAGSRPRSMRWVVLIGIVLAIAAMSLAWIIPALDG